MSYNLNTSNILIKNFTHFKIGFQQLKLEIYVTTNYFYVEICEKKIHCWKVKGSKIFIKK